MSRLINTMKLMLAVFSVVLIVSCSQTSKNQNSDKPNILLIVVDDQGYADFSPFENYDPEISTPNMNRVFGKGPRPSTQFIEPIQDDKSLKLFNLGADPGERINLAAQMPEKVKELETAYNKWLKENSGNY